MTTIPEQICEVLVAGGVRVAFGVPGGQTVPYYKALEASPIEHVLMRDERNAACAADAYARITGTLGVCDATVGPGATNLVSGLAEAYASSTPVLAIVADLPRQLEHLRRRGVASQALDQAAILAPVTKWIGRVQRADALVPVLLQAIRVATTGRPGPVAVTVPDDLLRGEGAEALAPTPDDIAPFVYPAYRSAPPAGDLAAAAELISRAERPAILAGGGVLLSGGAAELARLAEAHQIPVATTLGGKGAVDEGRPLALGVSGIFGTAAANRVLAGADVLLVLGSKLSQFATLTWSLPAPGQTVIHVDLDGEEIGRTGPVALGIVADAKETLVALAAAIERDGAEDWSAADRPPTELPAAVVDTRIRPRDVVGEIDRALAAGDVLLTDASLASGWGSQYYRVKHAGRSFLAPRGLAGTGWAGGGAIGARMGMPAASRLVALAGDGSWGYALAEIETAVRVGRPIVYVILNNAGLGWIKLIHGELTEASAYGDIDFAATARAMGASGVRVPGIAEFRSALAEALAGPGPALIELSTNIEDTPVQRAASPSVEGAYS
jgi:acetolactate synthase-1/2/3 large subunit